MESQRLVLLGPYPPPQGGVATFTSALFEFTKDNGIELWAAGDDLPKGPNVWAIKYRRLGLIPILLRRGYKARIVDSFYFLVEYPHYLMVPVWLLFKLVLRFDWIKVVHDGSLPARYEGFTPLRKALFKLSVGRVHEFVAVNGDISRFLKNTVGVRQSVRTMNALLPLPAGELAAATPKSIEVLFERHDKVVISTGVFIESYGFAHAAMGVERVRRDTGQDIGLLLIDGGFARDEAYRSEVLRGREWITVLEKVPHSHVLQIFRRGDVFVRGFRYEGYGLSRIEAVWCGIPVIAAMGEESRGMLLYEFGDIDTLTKLLKEALAGSNKENIASWGAVFQRQAEENLERWKEILQGQS